MKLMCIKSKSLVGNDNPYFLKNKMYEIIKNDDYDEFVIDDENFKWRYSTVSYLFITLKEHRKQKLKKINENSMH